MNLDMSKPIFVYYLYIGNINKSSASELIAETEKYLRYDDATIWIVPIHEGNSRIEMIHEGYR